MWITKKRKKNSVVHSYTFWHIVCVLIASFGALFVTLSFLTYYPTDASWLYYADEREALRNLCGSVGAHGSAFFFYLFGNAFYGFIPLVWYVWYLIFVKRLLNSWERIFAGFMSIVISSALVYAHYALLDDGRAGGYIGVWFYNFCYTFFDRVGTWIVLSILLCGALIVLTRCAIIFYAMFFMRGIVLCGQYIYHYRIVQRLTTYLFSMVIIVVRFLWHYGSLWYHAVSRFYDGSLWHNENVSVYQDTAEYAPEKLIVQNVQDGDQNNNQNQYEKNNDETEVIVHTNDTMVHNNPDQDSMMTMSQALAETIEYQLPEASFFWRDAHESDDALRKNELEKQAHTLEEKLKRFGVTGSVTSIKRGPVVTLFEYQPSIDTKLSKIIALEDDLALALQALSIRILAPIPGRSVVGFEVANTKRIDVPLASLMNDPVYQQTTARLPLVLGHDTVGEPIIIDLVKMPHLLIAGSTGSGKSMALNTMLMSLLCKRRPDEMKLILIDPKRLEFASYADIAHLLFPIVTDPKKVSSVLRWVVNQMEERYQKMALSGVRNIVDYNNTMNADDRLPFIVVVIDELADVMMTAGRDIEDLIARITQMARAAGIHMIVATQRPSVDVITGLIKVNFPSRISFRVTSKVDSRTILDCNGADKLLGRGDMLFLDSSTSRLKRVHGAYVSDDEIEQVVEHIKAQQQVVYLDMNPEEYGEFDDDADVLLRDVITFLQEVDEISISLLQRRFKIGYNRSARIIEMLEDRGMILPAHGGKMRTVVHGYDKKNT